MGTAEPLPSPASSTAPSTQRPAVHVYAGDALAQRIASLGWEVVRVDAAGAEAARTRQQVVVTEEASSQDDARLAAIVAGAVAEQAAAQLAVLRTETRKTAHDGKNVIGVLWMHLSALERAAAQASGDGPPPGVKEIIGEIKDETRAIVALLDQLGALARR